MFLICRDEILSPTEAKRVAIFKKWLLTFGCDDKLLRKMS